MNPPAYSVTLLGTGNVATHFGLALARCGFDVQCVYGRDMEKATRLAHHITMATASAAADVAASQGCATKPLAVCQICDIPATRLVLLCVSDDAIGTLAHEVAAHYRNRFGNDTLFGTIIAHTAGSVTLSVFEGVAQRCGVIYPLQTLSRTRETDFSRVPLFIEGSDDATQALLEEIARTLSCNVTPLNSAGRRNLHLAAVFACNFPNALFGIAERLLSEAGVNFRLLAPLVRETADKFLTMGAQASQTGPAARGDKGVMARHEEMLAGSPSELEIYRTISRYIQSLR